VLQISLAECEQTGGLLGAGDVDLGSKAMILALIASVDGISVKIVQPTDILWYGQSALLAAAVLPLRIERVLLHLF
jgi:hypothetical protein